jgi:hypothetical protein
MGQSEASSQPPEKRTNHVVVAYVVVARDPWATDFVYRVFASKSAAERCVAEEPEGLRLAIEELELRLG